jgi:hypothetical protein
MLNIKQAHMFHKPTLQYTQVFTIACMYISFSCKVAVSSSSSSGNCSVSISTAHVVHSQGGGALQ